MKAKLINKLLNKNSVPLRDEQSQKEKYAIYCFDIQSFCKTTLKSYFINCYFSVLDLVLQVGSICHFVRIL